MKSKISANEARQALISEYGIKEDVVSTMNNKECISRLTQLENDTGLLNEYGIDDSTAAVINEKNIENKNLDIDIMSMFREDEIFDDYPTLTGLRRVANELIGEIVSSTSDIHQVPSIENGYRSTVKHRLTFLNSKGKHIIFDGCADAGKDNTQGVFGNVLVAMAETRAEARAYRRALNIKTPSYEEMDNNNDNQKIKESLITSSQILVIKNQCDRLDLNVNKFLAKSKGIDFDSLKNLTEIEGLELIKLLKSYRNDEAEIPEEIKI